MAQINKYTNKAAYTADTDRLATKSAVSFITDDNLSIFDGVNIVVEKQSASEGDLVVFDKSESRVRVVKAATVNKAQLPANLVPVGVVYARRGKKTYMVALDNATSKRWAATYEVALSGFDLANGGTFTLRINTTETTFTYAAGATLADIAANIAANLPHYNAAGYGGWTASASDNAVIMSSNTYSAAMATIAAVSGVAITRTSDDRNYQTSLTDLLIEGSVEYVRRNNRVNSNVAGCNRAKFIEYEATNGTTPAANVAVGSATIVNRASFNDSEYCADLRAAYTTYEAYLLGEHELQYPASYGAGVRDGKTNTAKIGTLRFTDIRSSSSPCYPAAAEALAFGVTAEGYTTGFEAGAWWLPSVDEIFLLMRDRAFSSATLAGDPVNTTLVRMAKSTCYGNGSYPWTSCEYNFSNAFFYYGNGGVNVGTKDITATVRPVSAF